MAQRWDGDEPSDGRPFYMACTREHGSFMLVSIGFGGAFCLECFTELIAAPSSLVVHKAKAISEFAEALTDTEFCAALIQKRPAFLAAPLAKAIFFSNDADLVSAIIDVMVTTCKLDLKNDDTILQDMMLQVCLLFSTSEATLWKQGCLFSVRGLTLLLELHCQHDNHIPHAIKSQPGCVQYLIKALSFPTDEVGIDVFFIFSSLANLEDGINFLAKYCPVMVHLAIKALERSQNDELRTKSLDLLIALAQASAFNISQSTSFSQRECDDGDQESTASICQTGSSSVEQFAEAMKASLLSSDTQVQVKSLELINLVCSMSLETSEEIQSLVNEGLTDYIFEVLRISGNLDAIATSAIQALETLSLAFQSFSQHFSLGLEPLLRVLNHSFASAFGTLQKDTLNVICSGIAHRPDVVGASRAEYLVELLKKSFQLYRSVMKDHAVSDTLGFGLSPEGLNATCNTLGTLLRAPSCSRTPSICLTLQECICALTDCISADPIYATHHKGLMSAAYLFQEAYIFSIKQTIPSEQFTALTDFLMTHFHFHMLSIFTTNWNNISDEITANAFFDLVRNILQTGDAIKTRTFARILVSKNWISMAYETMSRFPTGDFKQIAYSTISKMIDRLSSSEEAVQDVMLHLPTDVEGLLLLLEQRNDGDLHLIAAHQAIIAILFTAVEHGDSRFVGSDKLMSSLEQHLLVNASSSMLASPSSAALRHFFLLFIHGHEDVSSQGRFRSRKAENNMVDILQTEYISSFRDYELPMHALKWIMKKEILFPISKDLLLRNLYAGSEDQAIIAQLTKEDDRVTEILMSLFLDVVERHLEDEIGMVATGLASISKGDLNLTKKIHRHGVVSILRRFILLQGMKASESTVTSCVDLLFQQLVFLDETMVAMDEGAWLDIASQAEKLLVSQLDKGKIVRTCSVSLVNLITLIMHKSTKILALKEAASKVYTSSELRETFEQHIANASQKGSVLTTMDINSDEGVTLSASLLFCVLWLRGVSNGTANMLHEGMNDRNERTSSKSINGKRIGSSPRISCQQLCQLLCFCTTPLQILTSSCLVELLSYARANNGKMHGDLAECSLNHLRSVTLILQGTASGGDGLLRKNACICLMRLLEMTSLNMKQKAVRRSPWYKVVAQELLLPLANGQVDVVKTEEIYYSPPILTTILCVSPPNKWLPSVFSSKVLGAVIQNFKNTQYITVETVELFLELLKRGFLEHEQVETLRALYLGVRRKYYRERSVMNGASPTATDKESFAPNPQETVEKMDPGAFMMHLALRDTGDHFVKQHQDAEISKLDNESRLLVQIDEFLQRSDRDME
uniref:Uncharacterized protein n=2 Tax=Physcomitrium patens TaxID=3218 RepID=A0A7I4B3F2_PHYPA|nr:protein PRD1-like isoform X1 [Physcomitrium patens]|eukprot:XP_024396071.1 protein PRD1-like isoform X1 [Physcomitrella patens]